MKMIPDVFEGSLVRAMRRLEELTRQMAAAAKLMVEHKKEGEAMKLLKQHKKVRVPWMFTQCSLDVALHVPWICPECSLDAAQGAQEGACFTERPLDVH